MKTTRIIENQARTVDGERIRVGIDSPIQRLPIGRRVWQENLVGRVLRRDLAFVPRTYLENSSAPDNIFGLSLPSNLEIFEAGNESTKINQLMNPFDGHPFVLGFCGESACYAEEPSSSLK